MIIETKHDIDEFVWVIINNQINCLEINNIWIGVDEYTHKVHITYKFRYGVDWDVKDEKEVFKTKHELLDYLAKQ